MLFKKFLFLVLICSASKTNAQEIKSIDSEQLFTCFKQGNRGNCVSIALIKAAICVFGINGIFTEKKVNDTLIEVILKNGRQYNITNSEILKANTELQLIKKKNEDNTLLNYATKCFAIMAKVNQKNQKIERFESSLDELLSGAIGHKSYYLLGLENNCIILDSNPNYHSFCGGVAWTRKHVVFVCNGFMDKYGKKVRIGKDYYGGFKLIK